MSNLSASVPSFPRIKPIFDLLYLNDRVRLGSGPAYASEIEDPDGRYGKLVRLLDGSRSIDDLARDLADVLSREELDEALGLLFAEGFLEDAREEPPKSLSSDELERYRPNINFFRTLVLPGASCFAPQALLKDTRVALFGLGGIGSNVCMALAELGVGHITAVDFDRVELSNLNRQVLYSTPAVGQPKAKVAEARMAEFNPEVDFVAEQTQISSVQDVEEFLARAQPDHVFCLADRPNGFIDFWINEVCVRRGVAYSAASISSRVGTLFSVDPGAGPCYQCRVDGEAAEHPDLAETLEYVRRNEVNASNGALGPACMFMAYFLAYELLRQRISGMGPMLAVDRVLEIDFVTFEQSWHTSRRRPGCPVCGVDRAGSAAADQEALSSETMN